MTIRSDILRGGEDVDPGRKAKRLIRVLKDAALAGVLMPIALVAIASALATVMALIWK